MRFVRVCVYGTYIDYYGTHSPLAEAKGKEGKGHGNQGISCMRQGGEGGWEGLLPFCPLSYSTVRGRGSQLYTLGEGRRTFFGPSALFPQRGEDLSSIG